MVLILVGGLRGHGWKDFRAFQCICREGEKKLFALGLPGCIIYICRFFFVMRHVPDGLANQVPTTPEPHPSIADPWFS